MRTTSGNGSSSKRPQVTVAKPKPNAEVRSYTPVEWHEMVAKAAYFRAEQRGFTGGSEEEDWLAAEAELKSAMGLHSRTNH